MEGLRSVIRSLMDRLSRSRLEKVSQLEEVEGSPRLVAGRVTLGMYRVVQGEFRDCGIYIFRKFASFNYSNFLRN